MGSTTDLTMPAMLAGIVTSTAYSSANLGCSLMAIPALLLPRKLGNEKKSDNSDSLLARQWQAIYNAGHRIGPVTAILSASCFIYAALKVPEADTTRRALLFTSAGLTITVFPYTWISMLQVNNELHRRAGTQSTSLGARATAQCDGAMVDRDLLGLIDAWASMGVTRALWPIAGVIVASIALTI